MSQWETYLLLLVWVMDWFIMLSIVIVYTKKQQGKSNASADCCQNCQQSGRRLVHHFHQILFPETANWLRQLTLLTCSLSITPTNALL